MFKHDFTGVTESGAYTPIPEGKYLLTVSDTTEAQTRNGDEMVKVLFIVAEGKYKGRRIYHNVSFLPKDSKGAGISKHFLKVLGLPCEGQITVNPLDWRRRQLLADVGLGSYTDSSGKEWQNNNISAVHSLSEEEQKASETGMNKESKAEVAEDILEEELAF